MTEQELKNWIDELDRRYKKEKNRLINNYALSNNKVKVGDIVSDNIGSIRVDEIMVMEIPIKGKQPAQCIYHGLKISKNGKINKKGIKRDIYQLNLIN